MKRGRLKRIFFLFVIVQLFVIVVPVSVFAGDEQNPEITDDENDIYTHPNFYYPERSLKAIDIVSAWFHEDQNESDSLFITIKIVDLNHLLLQSTYLVEWGHGLYVYTAKFTTQFLGLYAVAIIFRSYPVKIHFIKASFHKEDNLVTFMIPKKFIDNPQPGDVLTRTRAGSILSSDYGNFLDFYFAIDTAPDFQPSGKNYIVQY